MRSDERTTVEGEDIAAWFAELGTMLEQFNVRLGKAIEDMQAVSAEIPEPRKRPD